MKTAIRTSAVALALVLGSLTVGVLPVQAEENDLTNATLWTQTAVEFKANALGAYKLAEMMLDKGLADKYWTAATEQKNGYQDKPPAVILDIDETVLDNSAYEAWLIKAHTGYSSKTWAPFVNSATSKAIPGSKEFINYAHSKGVEVFYVSNRKAPEEAATRKNLVDLGYYVNDKLDTILVRGEKKEWGSNKTNRRAYVAKDYRIVLLIGDNLGDFVAAKNATISDRAALLDTYKDYWSTKWITVSNPMYGSWEAAAFGYNFKLSGDEKRKMKLDALTYWEPKQ